MNMLQDLKLIKQLSEYDVRYDTKCQVYTNDREKELINHI